MKFLIPILLVLTLLFSGCNNGDGGYEDGNGAVFPVSGYTIFPWEEHEQAFNKLKPNIVRFPVTSTDSINDCVNRIRWYRRNGATVMLCLANKHNFEATIDLAVEYARRHNEGVIFEFWNEQNIEIAPPSEGWHSKIDPVRYANAYKIFREKLKRINPNIRTTWGGLAGGEAIPYRQRLVDLGCQTDFWNWHNYRLSEFYSNLKHCRNIDKGKPIIIGEFGTEDSNEDKKIAVHKKFVDKFTLNGVTVSIVYAWGDGANWSIKTRPRYSECVATYKRL